MTALVQRYRGTGVWRDRTLADDARTRAEAEPDRIVFPNDPTAPTYASLLSQSEALAIGLADLGLRAGDVVSFQIFNWIEAAIINLAAGIAGFVINPIVPIYRDAEVRQMLRDSGAKLLFYPGCGARFDYAAMVARLRDGLPSLVHAVPVRAPLALLSFDTLVAAGRGRSRAWPRTGPDDVKLLLYTSGTTGRPKGVLHSQNSLSRVCAVSFAKWGIVAGDAILMPSPVTHISGYANALEQPFICGTRTVLMERWDARMAVNLIERHEVVATVAATPFLKELADTARAIGATLPSLKVFACGGAAVPADLVNDANTAFAHPCAFRVFGASEVPLVTLGFSPRQFPALAAATDGAVIDYDVRIIGADGVPTVAGAEGEILVRGPAMFLGYADAAQTAEALTEDGYFRTGDLGRIGPHDALVITGRKKDLIIRGGENISAVEIEDVLRRCPNVRDVAVVSMPHGRLGEGVCAFVVADNPQPTHEALVRFVAASGLAKQKYPERIEYLPELPRTASGKIRKDLLRECIRAILNVPQVTSA